MLVAEFLCLCQQVFAEEIAFNFDYVASVDVIVCRVVVLTQFVLFLHLFNNVSISFLARSLPFQFAPRTDLGHCIARSFLTAVVLSASGSLSHLESVLVLTLTPGSISRGTR